MSLEASVFHRWAAISTSKSRAATAMLRSCGAMVGVVRLPKVPMSHGTRSVSPMIMVMESKGTRSSSATACASEVRMFWPTSTLPVKTFTWPSASIWIQALMSVGSS